MSKNISQSDGLNENLSQDKTAVMSQELESIIDHDNIEGSFYNAVYGDEGQETNIGGVKIWMTEGDTLNYEIIEPSETNEGILSILLAMSLENDITLNEIKLKDKALAVEDGNSRILNYFYRLIDSLDFEPLDYIKDLIEKSGGRFDVNVTKPGYELPLIYALKNGTTLDMIQCLVEDFDCNVNVLDQENHTPLYHAFNMKKASSFKIMIVDYLIKVKATLTADEQKHLVELSNSTDIKDHMFVLERLHDNDDMLTTKKTLASNSSLHIEQITLDMENATFTQGVENNYQTRKTHDNQLSKCLAIATESKKKIAIEGTNFVIQRKVNGALNVSNDEESEIFLILSKITRVKRVEFEFIYDKHTASSLETFTGSNYDDLISQVLNDKKCLYLPSVDLIFQNNGNAGIECFIGKVTFDKLELLCDIAKKTGETLTCDGLRSLDVPQEQQIPFEKIDPDAVSNELSDVCMLLEAMGLPGNMDLPD